MRRLPAGRRGGRLTLEHLGPDDRAELLELLRTADLPTDDLVGPEWAVRFLGCRGPEGKLLGAVGLEGWGEAGLLRSLVVAPGARGQGLGARLVAELEALARDRGVKWLYLLTLEAGGFFSRLGYRPMERAALPPEIAATPEASRLCPASAVVMSRRVEPWPEESGEDLIDRYGLQPHPEGGWYRELFRSELAVRRGQHERSALTTIYFLLTAGQVGRWHVVTSDEVWHYLAGAPLEIPVYDPGSQRAGVLTLGPVGDPARPPAQVVPAGWWQASRTAGSHTLVGCTVGPGFDFADFEFVGELPGHEVVFDGPLAGFRDLL